MSTDFLRELFDARVEASLLVKGHDYEDLRGREADFHLLERGIKDRRCVRFSYNGDGGAKEVTAQPHKLVNAKGIWYLAAKHEGKLKTYSLSRMSSIALLPDEFQPDADLLRRVESDDGIWVSEKPIEVVLLVSKDAAPYFLRRKLIANQVIEKQLADGGLLIATTVGHANQVLPIVRYWLPHIRIVSPETLQHELEQSLLAYLKPSQRS